MSPVATLSAPVQRQVILRGVSGETCRRLLAEHTGAAGTQFVCDRGMPEIKVLSSGYEEANRTLAAPVVRIAGEWGIDFRRLGPATFQREGLQEGFEPDSAFYANAARRLGKPVDPAVDPSPDRIMAVDVSSDSLPRFPICAALGVPEVWRDSAGRVSFRRLEGGRCVETPSGPALPHLVSVTAILLLHESRRLPSSQWTRRVREWARGQC
jgi:Uma2 family endonuclease